MIRKKVKSASHLPIKKAKNTSSVKKHTLQYYAGILLLFLLLFSICLVSITNIISKIFRDDEPDINKTIQQYLSTSFSSNIDSLYTYNIDKPMENFFNSSAVTSFLFCTPQYPPADELKEYLQEGLSALASNSDYITAAAIYASASNTCVSSQCSDDTGQEAFDLFFTDMVYDYNSNALDKNKIASSNFNTFLFGYQDYIIFSKDLTTLSGSPHATLFLLMDMDAFSSFLYKANGRIPYRVSVYDAHNKLLFSNTENGTKMAYTQLLDLASSNFSTKQINNTSYIYCGSDTIGIQYILEMDLLPIPGSSSDSWLMYLIILFTVIVAVLLVSVLIFFRFRDSAEQFAATMELLGIKGGSPAQLSASLNKRVDTLINENAAFQKIVRATSSEAVSHLFAKLITGEPVEKDETRITLSNTGYGFRIDDIYIAGILHQTVSGFIKASNRNKILNLLNSIFEKFKEKTDCNVCAFLFDEKSFVIIASFPAGTSIAKGKAKINDLTQKIMEGIAFLQLPMIVSFGHMYNSILDLPFSYNEAFKTMHYKLEAAANADTNTDAIPFPPSAPEELSSSPPDSIPETEDIPASQDVSEQIDRRASQIAQLIWDGREDHVSSLVERTLSGIFKTVSPAEQSENCKRLISALTSHMLSYPFVNDSHLTNVYDTVLPLINTDSSSETLHQGISDALSVLCHDFSEAIKKQHSPYIIATQRYIELHYSNPDLSLEEIAENLKIAPNYLSTIFSKNLGIKLFEYINKYRIEKSIKLLLDTDMTVNDISTECGFNSSRNYIRIFKKYKENTPGAYRKQHLPAAQAHKQK
ncbi:MAG: AraC family transcriptional regulator [Eubacteriales bacterium]|nr:AraC family transcriptional regulator [Eubacteriales bacterium]